MNEIHNELRELNWNLPHSTKPVQEVPEGYFNAVNQEVLNAINIETLSQDLTQEMPQTIPDNYFENFNAEVLAQVEQPHEMTVHKTSKYKPWALAASIALILTIGLLTFQGTENVSIDAQLAQITDADLIEYMEDNAYEFNDYVIEGHTAELKKVEAAFFEETAGLTKDELLEYAL